jgi:hypothetical protein
LLKKNPKASGYYLYLDVEIPGRNGIGTGGRVQQLSLIDSTGVLQFAERPQDAPILHFGGTWQVTLLGKEELTIDRKKDVILGIGSLASDRGASLGASTRTSFLRINFRLWISSIRPGIRASLRSASIMS